MFTYKFPRILAVAFLLTGFAWSAADRDADATEHRVDRIFTDVIGQGVPGAAVLVRRNMVTRFFNAGTECET
jgi:hypothetical protein